MERYAKYKRKSIYLYIGLGFAVMALIMFITSVLSAVRGDRASVLITGFGAGIAWGTAAAACLRAYYRFNRSELSVLESPDISDKQQ